MFIERYRDLLEEGGRLLTVIDDGMLAGDDFASVRDFIRGQFLIRGIISLPGDAFQRSGARAKTTVLYLEKRRRNGDEGQPDVFAYECRYVGLDDVVPKTRPSVAERARKNAEQEIEEVLTEFDDYMNGKSGPWLVPAERLSNRLDAKSLRPWRAIELQPKWNQAGATSDILANLVDPIWHPVHLEPNRQYTFLRVLYAGYAERGEMSLGKEVGYSEVSTAKAGDIIVSHINAVNRAICVLPDWAEDLLISKEYTILRPKKNKVDPNYLWAILRSAAVVAEWLSGSTGVGRHRVGWDQLRDQQVPLLSPKEQKAIGDQYRKAEEYEVKVADLRASAITALGPLELEGETAVDRLARAKPPK
jgi:type I restriction enzyme M protein